MNYLAHLYLAKDIPELMIGGLLGDFVKGSIGNRYLPLISKGIELHRKIDSYTDNHRLFLASKNIVSPQRRRFAGIMIDLFYDHFLAIHWYNYSKIPLNIFSQQVYEILMKNQELFPGTLSRILPYMVEQDWLTSYQDVNNIGKALNRISIRFKYKNTLFNSVEELESNYSLFEEYFHNFFPDLIDYVEIYKSSNQCTGN